MLRSRIVVLELPCGALALLCALAVGCTQERTEALEELQSPMAEVRATAVGKLGRSAREDDFPAFLKVAQDPSALVRRATCDAFARMRDPRTVDVLADLLGDSDPDVQVAAAAALIRIPSPKARPYLVSGYARRGGAARAAIVESLSQDGVAVADPVRAEARLLWDRHLQGLQSGAVAERVGAAEELGRSARPEALEKLRPLLQDSSVLLAAAAARGLGAAGDATARAELEPLLADQFPQLREAAAEGLALLGDAAAVPALAQAAASDPSPAAVAAADALGRLPGSGPAACQAAIQARHAGAAQVLARHAAAQKASCDVAPLLERVARGGSDAVAALAAAGLLRAAAVLEPARTLAADEAAPAEVRVAAVHALGEAGGAEDLPPLAALEAKLWDQYQAGRAEWIPAALPREYAKGFAPPKDEEYEEKYQELMKKVDDEARKGSSAKRLLDGTAEEHPIVELVADLPPGTSALLAATVQALCQLRSDQGVARAQELLRDADPELRTAAVAGLAALGTDTAAAAVRAAALEDRDAAVRNAAVEALARMSGTAAAQALAEVATRADTVTRVRALRALGERRDATVAAAALEVFKKTGLPEAAATLGKLGSREAVPALLGALRTPAVGGRLEVVEALGQIADPSAAAALHRELFHDRPEVRTAAARALGRLRHVESKEALEALAAEDYYGEVRRAAAAALQALAGGDAVVRP